MMILPMPAFVLDLGLTVSFGLAILVFTNTLFISRPLDFSAFPTVLLAALMLRLSLNISSTKLIIGEGHNGPSAAGEVIEGFAMFVMGGSVYLGVVVFGVLMIVNFIVITKGAGRMAEVGARFALDGMPGRQLAIDSDMAAGAISHEEARERRKTEQEETTFFGSLDGASKFVLAASGHIAGVVNPPSVEKYGYWTNTKKPASNEDWFASATEHKGSWWPDWHRWARRNSDGLVAARQPGAGNLSVIEDAPGSYVRRRFD